MYFLFVLCVNLFEIGYGQQLHNLPSSLGLIISKDYDKDDFNITSGKCNKFKKNLKLDQLYLGPLTISVGVTINQIVAVNEADQVNTVSNKTSIFF